MRGACHVFAAVLYELTRDEDYHLVRIASNYVGLYQQCSDPARHVACSKGDFIVHAAGVEQWNEYEKRTLADIRSRSLPGAGPVTLLRHKVADGALLLKGVKETGGQAGLVNEWELTVNPDFVAEVRTRAERFIHAKGDTLRLSKASHKC